jgi:hypothetical protein
MAPSAARGSVPGRSRAKTVQPDAVPPAHIVPGGRHYRLHHERDEQIRRAHQRQTLEPALRDTHDGHRMPIDVNRAVQCGRIASEPALPVVIAQHHIRFAAFALVFVRSEHAAKSRHHSQNVEIVARHQLGGGPLGRSFVRHVDRILISRRDAGEGIGRTP